MSVIGIHLRYWRFWWPLALVGLALPLSRVLLNGGLARMPDGTTELAVMAYAQGLFFLAQSAMVFMPQLANILARSRADHQRCRRFAICAALLLILPLLLLALPLQNLLGAFYGIGREQQATVASYLLGMAPLLVTEAFSGYHIGLLVRHQRTGWVSVATISYLVVITAVVMAAHQLGWSALSMVIVALSSASIAQASIVYWAWRRCPSDFVESNSGALGLRTILRFFIPLAITSMMFAASRPVIYALIGFTDNPIITVAVLRVAFDLGMLAQIPVNQFRHLLVTFVSEDPRGVARFMWLTTLLMSAIPLTVILTPLAPWIMGELLGAEERILEPIRSTWLILTLVPLVVAWRNWHHGIAMLRRRTGSMALAGVLRVIASALICLMALGSGLLDHHMGALALLLGFVIEALIMRRSLFVQASTEDGQTGSMHSGEPSR